MLAIAGAIIYPMGWIIGSLGLSSQSLLLIYLGFGVMGGIGLGLGYVTPVATAIRLSQAPLSDRRVDIRL